MNKHQAFGGAWTREKLNILEAYLDAYTTVLKNKPFKLIYIDAFAGSGGYVTTDHDGIREFHEGSVRIALGIENKRFDRLVFVETDQDNYKSLEQVKDEYSDRNITLVNEDAHTYLNNLSNNWSHRRGVLLLDPYGTQVSWQMIEKIASFKALDLWILFPVLGISRILPVSQVPDDIEPQWATRLTKCYGNENWRNLYRDRPYRDLLDGELVDRERGVAGLIEIYKQQLESCFGQRFLRKSRSVKNTRGSSLFKFIFCAGHPSGATVAKRIAGHIVEHL